MIQYIASDVDGTLLHGHATTLNPELFDIIRQLKEHGIHFIAASGRQYKNLQRLFAPVKDDISYVAENGSMCVHDGKIVSLGHIDTDLMFKMCVISRSLLSKSQYVILMEPKNVFAPIFKNVSVIESRL